MTFDIDDLFTGIKINNGDATYVRFEVMVLDYGVDITL